MKLSDDPTIRYHTIIGDHPCGPFTFEGMESLLYLEKITPETLVRREGIANFSPIKATELGPLLFPPTPSKNCPQNWPAPGRAAAKPTRPNQKRFRLTTAKFERVNSNADVRSRITVVDILNGIRQAEADSGQDRVRRRRFRLSRRSLDFWITLIAGNALFLGGAFFLKNTASMIFGIGGSGLFTFGLLWTMYGIMDDY